MVYAADFFFSAIGAGWTLFILLSLFHWDRSNIRPSPGNFHQLDRVDENIDHTALRQEVTPQPWPHQALPRLGGLRGDPDL